MSAPASIKPDASFSNDLLALNDRTQQAALLQKADLLNQAGLTQLLDVAMALARSNPGQAQQLTILCADFATAADAPDILPKATYIRAQTHAVNGELDEALKLIQLAHTGYLALGEELPALRTNLGLMHVLIQSGRYQEALDTGHSLLQQLHENLFEGPDANLITTLTHNNLGLCYWRMGRYEEALSAFAAAEAHGLSAGLMDRLGDIRNNRGIILMYLGRAGEALLAFQASAMLYAEAGLTLLHGQSLINIGEACLFLGDYTRSLEALAQAHHLLSAINAQAEEHLALLHRADVYLALNLVPEALADYRQAGTYYQKAGMPHYLAQVRWGMGAALLAQSDLAAAEEFLSEAASLFEAAGNVPLLCSVLLEQATLQAARGQRELALATARQAHALVAGQGWPVQQCYAHLRLADLLVAEEVAAESHLLSAQKLLEDLALPHLRYRLQQRLGQLRRRQGRDKDARQLLAAAAAEIERLRGTVAQEAMRTSFLADKIVVYEELLQLHLAAGRAKEAFEVAERAKSRALLDLLTGVVRVSQPAAGSDSASRRQRLQADLNALYNNFLAHPAKEGQPAAWQELYVRAQELEREISRLHLQALPTNDTQADYLSTVFSFNAIRSQLAADVCLLAYHVVGDEIIAFTSREDRLEVVQAVSTVTTVKALQQRLGRQWDRFRAGRAFAERHMSRLEQSAQRTLAALYDELMAPLIALLGAAEERDELTRLAIVPHGPLHQVPFHALYDGKRYLLEQFEITYAPSATVLALCQQRERRPIQRALVTGVSDQHIPAVTAEVQAVAHQLAGAVVQSDEQARLSSWQESVAGCDVLHLACHGLFRADNPMFSALKLYDGWLTAADILQLRLDGTLVTLSACESGRSQVAAGDEVIGLTRAFLGAGAATVVVSLWLVQDETTAALMADWYAQLQRRSQASRAAALRAAQLNLKAKHSHPYYWAPFVLVGRR